ncbi:uncharacterized protein METZ01_LOCUS390170, partial [marine metagenome]
MEIAHAMSEKIYSKTFAPGEDIIRIG